MLRNIKIIIIVLLGLLGAVSYSEEKSAEKETKVSKKKSDIHWSRLINIMKQMDAIDRESWWVLTGQKTAAPKSVFGKVMRAAQIEEKVKLTQKHLFNCDKYYSQRNVMSLGGFPQKIVMSNACQKLKEQFVEIMWMKSEELNLVFNPEALTDVIGLNASILGRKINCEIKTDEKGIVQNYSCKNMIKNRTNTETIELETYTFDKKKNNQLTLKGNVMEELKVKRKIETTVPLTGKITVVETEILPPPGYRRKVPGQPASAQNKIETKPTQPQGAVVPNQTPVSPSAAAPEQIVAPSGNEQHPPPLNPDVLVQKVIEEYNAKPIGEPEYIEDSGVPEIPKPIEPQVDRPPSNR